MDKDLGLYLETIKDLEMTIYTQNELIKELRKRIGKLGIPRDLAAPRKDKAALAENLGGFAVMGMFAGAILLAVIGLFTSDGFFNAIWNVIGNGIGGGIAGLVIGGVIGVIMYFVEENRNENDYNLEMANYHARQAEDRERVEKEKIQIKKLNELSTAVMQKRAETEELLQKYYGIDIIPVDYRNIVAICSIYGYLQKGICSTLQGPDGAYAQYAMDLRFRRLEEKLDQVIASLERIRENQYVLYTAIKDGNNKIQRLIEKTDKQIKLAEENNQKMEIISYNQERQLAESRYQSNLQTYAFLKYSK